MSLSSENTLLLNISEIKNIPNARVAIVCTEWNEKIIAEQLKGAKKIAAEANAVITHEIIVPGSFELTYACQHLINITNGTNNAPQAIIAFGAVIRGGTPHFEYVCQSVTSGITMINATMNVPVIFGVLTLDNEQQAWERLGGPHGHKGEEAMIAALKMIKMKNQL